VIVRRQQRLGLLTAFARDQSDPLPLRAGVKEVDAAGCMLAADLDADDLVAQLEGKIEHDVGLRGAVADLEVCLAEPLATCRECKNLSGTRRAARAQYCRFELAATANA